MRRMCSAVLTAVLVVAGLLVLPAQPAVAATQPAGSLVGQVPVSGTPNVLDGRVLSIIAVGNTMVLGGTFTQVQNSGDATVLSRTGLLAFDKTTKKVSTTFVPQPNGPVNVVVPSADGLSVYVGGSFTTIGGVARKNLARIRLSDGAVMTTFNAGDVAGEVRDLRLSNNRLWVAGAFTAIAGRTQRALATLYPSSGAYHPHMNLPVAGVHNGGVTTVTKIDVNAAGTRLIAIGNFRTLNAVTNQQLFMLDLSGTSAAAASFRTQFFSAVCATAFDTYTRDLDFSPDGSFFVVSTTGAYGGDTGPCDMTARFETSAGGAAVPSWVNYTGGDTTYAVEITGSVVYTGGHARWQNNAYAADTAGKGAVSREGIAALDPANGLPLSWNPTRDRGVGVFDLLHTADGLWVGSDTERIGADYLRGRIALLPSTGGTTFPAVTTPGLPNDVYVAQPLGVAPDPTPVFRVNAGGPEVAAASGVPWTADTAGSPSAAFHNTSLTRTTYGTAVGSLDASVPAGTPVSLFSSELTGNSTAPTQSWNIPVQSDAQLEVRLYFANRSTTTQNVGQRRFNVDLEGSRVLSNFDVVAAVGNNRGMMRSFAVQSDGNIDLDLSRVGNANYPMISGIEVLRQESGPAPAQPLMKRAYPGTGAFGADTGAPTGPVDWNGVRGAFMINGYLYLAKADGTFSRSTFDGTSYGASQLVNTSDLLTPLVDWANEAKVATSMFYDNGRIYFTLPGASSLYYRYFTAESGVVGAKRLVATGNLPGIDFTKVRGAFTTGDKLFFASPTGELFSMDWAKGDAAGVPSGAASLVSGPGKDGLLWNARALFLFQDTDGSGAALQPTADFTAVCSSLDCTFDGASSTAPGARITSYAWDFGDGVQKTGAQVTHSFGSPGDKPVTLTVTTDKGGKDVETKQVAVTRVNRAPSASFTVSCTVLTCTADATGSSDPDGDPLSYAWDFGDDETSTDPSPSHTYASGGDKTITLTVSDGSLTGTATRTASPTAAEVTHVASASTTGNRTNHSITVPAAARAGDTLLLFMTTGTADAITGPAGWTRLESRTGSAVAGAVWTRTATAADASSTVVATTPVAVKDTMSLAVYRNPAGASSVAVSAAGGRDISGTTATTPTVDVSDPSSWLVSYWAEKSSELPTWTLPASVTQRTQAVGSGTGKVSSALADSGDEVAAGAAGGLTATASTTLSRTMTFSVAIVPRQVNRKPTAAFSTTCTILRCSMDASGSSDPDADELTYSWDFGDGATGSGVKPVHDYASGGSRTVTLTVSDGTVTDSTTRTVATSAAAVDFVASAATSGNRASHAITVPSTVRAGDTLLLFMTTNSSDGTLDDALPGWTLLQSRNGVGVRGRAWTKTATAGDAGSVVTVATSIVVKDAMTLSAYRSASGATSATASAVGGSDASSPSARTPSVQVPAAGSSWLVSYWSEKSSEVQAWTLPGTVTLRTQAAATSTGKVSAVLADSAQPVAPGDAGGLTATTTTSTGKQVTFSVVVTAQ